MRWASFGAGGRSGAGAGSERAKGSRKASPATPAPGGVHPCKTDEADCAKSDREVQPGEWRQERGGERRAAACTAAPYAVVRACYHMHGSVCVSPGGV